MRKKMNNSLPLQIFNNLQQDPHTIFKDGMVDIKSYVLTQNGYSIEVSDAQSVAYLIEKMSSFCDKEFDEFEKGSISIISSLQRQLENEKSKYETLKKNLQTEHDRELEKYQIAVDENKKYREWYGTLVSPILIIKEFWNEAEKKELDILIPPSKWKTGKGLGGEAGTTAKRYWISMLMEWGLIKQWGRGQYMANVGMYEALEVLNKMMKKQGLIPESLKEGKEEK
jgi:hypothetical protein